MMSAHSLQQLQHFGGFALGEQIHLQVQMGALIGAAGGTILAD